MNLGVLEYVVLVLLIVGGLNWGLAVFDFNLVETIFGVGSLLTNIVYGVVGLSSLYGIYLLVQKR